MVTLLSHLKNLKWKKNLSVLAAMIVFYGLGNQQGLWIRHHQSQIPSFEHFKKTFKVSDSVLYARDGRVLNSLRLNFKSRVMMWSELKDINPDFVTALVAKEDHRFYQHQGVDFLAWPGVFLDYFRGHKLRGASTLSMQLAKLIFKIPTKTFKGKLQQFVYALLIEEKWSKENILEAYLSIVPIRGDLEGLATASLMLLQKSPLYLTYVEQNLLLQLINTPSLQWTLLEDKVCRADLNCRHEVSLIRARTTNKGPSAVVSESESLAYHLHRRLLPATQIYSQVDYDLQVHANESVRQQLQLLKDRHVQDAAVLVLDNASGEILAYVGSSGSEFSQTPFVDMVKAQRQLGSTVKPFLYATAFEKKLITLGSWIEDSPVEIIFPNGTYSPSNHDRTYHGWVHPSQALASSLNVPAVKVIQLVGVEEFWKTLNHLGFTLDREPDHYGPSLALGVLDGSLWQLTQAYRKLATSQTEFFSKDTLQKISWILSHAPNRALSFGQDSILNVPEGFAVKTGTSKDMKDNWCVGFNKDYTVGVWVGNADSTSMQNILGVTGAAPIWRSVVDHLLKTHPGINRQFAAQDRTDFISPELSAQFQQEEATAKPAQVFNKNRILSPGKSAIYALDPSIPPRAQKILLEADGPQKGLEWRIHGKKISNRKWSPETGWQKIELYRGQEKLDESVFLVK